MEQDLTVRDLIDDNPRFQRPALKVLALFGDGEAKRRSELERDVQAVWDVPRVSPANVIDILVRNRVLKERVYVDDEPYDGGLADVQTDERIPDDAEAWSSLEVTEKGRRMYEAHEPRHALRALYEERPRYAEVYSAVLWACENDGGCSREDLEAQMSELAPLQRSPETGRKEVYPQYFLDALESVGAIEWDGAWRTTEAGRAVLEELR